MMEKLFWSVVSLLMVGVKLVAQNVGISTTAITPDPSAMLEVRATDKGLLIPRVALVQTTSSAPITNPAVSLLVYNTATVNDVTPGFYYWDGSQWIRLSTGSGSLPSWYLSGNVASPTDFIGTTNAQDFRVYTNNTEKLRVTTAGNVGIGTATPAAQLHTTGTVRFANYASGANGALLRTNASGDLQITNFTGNAADVLLGNGTFGPVPNNADWKLDGNTNGALRSIGTNDNFDFPIVTNGVERMRVTTAGNVGIGTAAPAAQLHTTGTVRFANYASGANGALLRTDASGNLQITNLTGSAADVLLGNGTFGPAPAPTLQNLTFNNSGSGAASGSSYNGTSALTISYNTIGAVGGSGTATRVAFWSGTNTLSSNANLYWDNTNNRLGIGTATPAAQLHTTGTVRFANYASGANGALLRTDANGELQITNFTGNASDVLLGNGTFGPAPSSSLWQDEFTYIRPKSTTGATYPYIYDDNSERQIYLDASGSNTKAGIYVYSSQNLDGGSWDVYESNALIKAYDFWGNNYNAAIIGYSWLDYAGSAAVVGAHRNGTPRAELATRSQTYPGSGSTLLYSLKLTGDFYNQDLTWGQSTTVSDSTGWIIRQVDVTTHETGSDGSAVWIHGEVDYYKTETTSFVLVQILRDGNVLSEVSEVSYADEDKTVHIQWVDEPTPGTHTYALRVYYPSGGMTYYGHQLHVVEIKR